MLVLELKPGGAIRIGEDIIVRAEPVSHRQVRIAVEAPPTVQVLREELVDSPTPARPEPAS